MIEKLPIATSNGSIWSILNNETGKWSKGGTGPGWNKAPKTWEMGPFKNHLNLFLISPYKFDYSPFPVNKELFIENTLLPKKYFRFGYMSVAAFPYQNCTIVESGQSLDIIGKYPAEDWVWNNVALPYYKKQSTKTFNSISNVMKELGINVN